ncbi:hypothetical protein HPB48_010798 [Haemaphysalis longicornis]|uniref:Uncharacterized protein n=1 Tax=Haemaphysalis longicornis TaxID=44386 RepID=A0A9J6GRA5_HAELO|nr:hypothetical protein HPB48_010798 [Haemaphysalis longicornis]
MLNRPAISVSVEAILPEKIKEVRITHRKNILVTDFEQRDAVETPQHLTMLGQMKVRAYVSSGQGVSVGVIYYVDVSLPDANLPMLVNRQRAVQVSSMLVASENHVVLSSCFKVTVPTHIKVGHFRHAVRPFVPKPLQCRKCLKPKFRPC